MKDYWNGLSSQEKTKYIIYTSLSIIVLVFAIRNWQDTPFHIFFTEIQIPVTLLIFISMLAGFGFSKFLNYKKVSLLKKEVKQLTEKVNKQHKEVLKKVDESTITTDTKG